MLKQCTIVLITSVTAITSLAQNLVPNPSFEEYLECPFSAGELDNQLEYWLSWQESPDFFHVCSNELEGLAGVPNNVWGSQNPITGDGYAGLTTFMFINPNIREYMAAPLVSPLVLGQSYYIVFHASLYDGGNKVNWVCATNHIGLRFFKNPTYSYFPPNQAFQPDNFAHVDYADVLVDSIGWTRIEGTFVADDDYNWIALGNFFTDDNTTTQVMNETGLCWGMYYIENVCIAPTPEECESLLSNKDNKSSSRVVIFPNPASSNMSVHSDEVISKIELIDLLGNLVFQQIFNYENKISLDFSNISKGLYVLRIFSTDSFSNHKILKE